MYRFSKRPTYQWTDDINIQRYGRTGREKVFLSKVSGAEITSFDIADVPHLYAALVQYMKQESPRGS